MNFRIAVCDDDKDMLSIISDYLIEVFSRKGIELELREFSEGKTLLEQHYIKPFQAIFLDICMPETDGFQIAEVLRKQRKKAQIIFVTSKDELVYQSFDYQPFHFIRKAEAAEMEKQFEHVVDKLIDDSKNCAKIKLPLPYGTTAEVTVSDIIMIQSDKNYLEYEFNDGRVLRVRESMAIAEEHLRKYDFIRISSRIMLNVSYVARVREREGEVVLKTGYVYSVSRNYKKSVISAYMKYLRSRS